MLSIHQDHQSLEYCFDKAQLQCFEVIELIEVFTVPQPRENFRFFFSVLFLCFLLSASPDMSLFLLPFLCLTNDCCALLGGSPVFRGISLGLEPSVKHSGNTGNILRDGKSWCSLLKRVVSVHKHVISSIPELWKCLNDQILNQGHLDLSQCLIWKCFFP